MSNPAVQEEQLLELLLQLKKTTPDQTRAILNAQPQIAYALMAVMVNLNAVNIEVIQHTLASYGALPAASNAPVVPMVIQAPPVVSSIPPHVSGQFSSRSGTPPYAQTGTPPHARSITPTYHANPPTHLAHPPSSAYPLQTGLPYAQQGPPPIQPLHNGLQAPGPPSYASSAPFNPAATLPDALAAIPEDQKPLTPETSGLGLSGTV
ncbi:hypothetical protein PHLCEN_2v2878 [Hermanssonia centrifuga]|uniref:Cleavage stimulation factor subunit 2 hinge domain-containing protein n=1 Tax=Hermanssonia centrifuga TaxID=98765 RepID=A0A2R6RI78_9APHY|nr:hypothetical protein PHLCEN_2v2878 [Hermanssonia centrifuga]